MRNLTHSRVTRNEALELLYTLSPLHYIRSIGFHPYEWQEDVLRSGHKRKVINGARQAGKSTIISSRPCHTAKFFPGSVSLIVAATEFQAGLDMLKVKDFIAHDPTYPKPDRSSDSMIKLPNGSWIMVVPATETSARGPSAPRLIILDEASRIEDIVYMSGIVPMLTDNKDCELALISTPHGRDGFFFKAMNNPAWERYEVRSPWEPADVDFTLTERETEEAYRRRMAGKGVRAYYSPRHEDREDQEFNLGEMGPLMYRQEYCVEFVEPEDQVFNYRDIERMMGEKAEAIDFEEIGEAEPWA